MAIRFTNTDKWVDTWFSDLKPLSKLLFMYLCDQCDIAGFLELNIRTISFEVGTDRASIERAFNELYPEDKQTIDGAARGEELQTPRILYSLDRKFIFIRNFIKHQRNLPLNENNKAHRGILKRLEDNLDLFGFQSIDDFFKAPSMPLDRGYSIGIGKGIGNIDRDKGGMGEKEKELTWRNSFDVYLEQATQAYRAISQDQAFIEDREKYHPRIDIKLSLEKSFNDFWGTEAGWKNKKSSRSAEINWVRTFKNALDQRFNQVYKQNKKDDDNKESYFCGIE